MSPAKALLKHEPTTISEPLIPPRLPNALAGTESAKPHVRVVVAAPAASLARAPGSRAQPHSQTQNSAHFQARVPVITGEAVYRGSMPVDGIISGQLGAGGSSLSIKQRPRSGPVDSIPELDGELSFKDMLRVNGHIAGKVTSARGTLIIDGSARVDGDIDVGVAVVSGLVNGDVIAQERVELGPAAIINGNISTRALTMRPGAVFQGDCRMLRDESGSQ